MIIFLNILLLPIIYIIKIKLILKVGILNYIRITNINFCSFPNALKPVDRVSQGGYTIEKILRVCGIQPIQYSPAKKIDLMLYCYDLTFSLFNIEEYIVKHNYPHNLKDIPCINLNCLDISKKKVAEVHNKVFNYPIDINPLKFHGLALEKSNINAVKDAKIVRCPIEKKKVSQKKVYNILINNTDNLGFCFHNRIYFAKGIVPFFILKKRKNKYRFLAYPEFKTSVKKISDYFSPKEIAQIELFFREFNCDYGEIDVLRDSDTNNIYIVDIANSPGFNSQKLTIREKIFFLTELSFAFTENILIPIIRKKNPLKNSTIKIKTRMNS